MKFEKQKAFSSLIEVSKWANDGIKTTYKGFEAENPFALYEKLKNSYNNFKDEFQANELIVGFEIYAHRMLYNLNHNLVALKFYKEEGILRFESKAIDDIIYSDFNYTEEEINCKIFEIQSEASRYKLPIIHVMINWQVEFTEKAIEYISASFLEEKNKEIIGISSSEPNYKNLYYKALEKLNVNGQLSTKAHFDGRKIDLLNLFWSLQVAGRLVFERRRDFEVFLENNFTFSKGGQINDVTAIQKEISDSIILTKDLRERKANQLTDDQKIEIKKKTETKNKFLDSLFKKLREVKLPPENGSDGFQ